MPTLAYEVVIEGELDDQTPSELHVIVDATTAAILDSWDGIETASGTGRGFFNGTVALDTTAVSGGFQLKDPTRGNQSTVDMKNKQGGNGTLFTDADNTWGDFTLANRQTVGVDAQYGAAKTWDYYKNIHGRNGIANDGRGAVSRVHYGRNYNNAFWQDSCFCMTYGDGDGRTFNPFDSLDVAGHEMSHGVTSRTANLVYSGESGGLNEATSDIFGTHGRVLRQQRQRHARLPDWRAALQVGQQRPASDVSPEPRRRVGGLLVWRPRVAQRPLLVGRRQPLLLPAGAKAPLRPAARRARRAHRATHGRRRATASLSGIGRAKAEKIWYRALTVYFTSNTNYAAARAGSLKAAADLYGAGSAEHNAVAAAWSAVNVN